MRLLATLLIAIITASCAATPAETAATQPLLEAPLLASDGGILRPIDNGGRVALQSGYATVRLWPSPQSMDPRLEVALFDTTGAPSAADVWVVYEMMDMDHGIDESHAVLSDGCYRMHLSFGMQGAWKLIVHVGRAGNEEKLTIVLPWVGL